MTTVKGSRGRRYEVRSALYGTRSEVYSLYYGGVFLASTAQQGPAGESTSTMMVTIERANEKADEMGIEVEK